MNFSEKLDEAYHLILSLENEAESPDFRGAKGLANILLQARSKLGNAICEANELN